MGRIRDRDNINRPSHHFFTTMATLETPKDAANEDGTYLRNVTTRLTGLHNTALPARRRSRT